MSAVAIRVDLNPQIGLGHFSRSLTLAEELIRRGNEVHIITETLPIEWENYARHAGVVLHRLTKVRNQPRSRQPVKLNNLDEWDAQRTARILTSESIGVLIVDCYGINDTWAQTVARNARLIVLDDDQNLNVACDIRVNFGISTSTQSNSQQIYCGPRLSLIHPAYRPVPQSIRTWSTASYNILVYLGATFQPDMFTQIMTLVERSVHNRCSITVLSSDFERYQSLFKSRQISTSLNVVEGGRTMASALHRVDFAIGAAGMSSMERACAGLPSLQLILTANQVANAEWLQNEGAAECIQANDLTNEKVRLRLSTLFSNPDQLKSMSEAGRRSVDGFGALRVAELVIPTKIHDVVMRLANKNDTWTFLEWRNDFDTRNNSFNSGIIDVKTHYEWFQGQLTNSATEMYVFELSGLPVSQLRLTKCDDSALINYSVDALFRGRGLGVIMMRDLVNRERKLRRLNRLKASVRKENQYSIKVFKEVGFSVVQSSDSEVQFEMEMSN